MQCDTCPTIILQICPFNTFWLVESWFFDRWSSGSRYIAQWKAVVRWPSAVRCICCHWTMYPKINFHPIRICLTHAQIRGMTVGRILTTKIVSPCIVCISKLYSLPSKPNWKVRGVTIMACDPEAVADSCCCCGVVFYGPSTNFSSFRAGSANRSTLFLGNHPRQFTST